MKRRQFIFNCCAGLGAASGFATNLASFNAHAADVSDYKALVCVFLRGAMDSHDTVIPFDVQSNNAFESIREPLIASLDNNREFAPRRRANLLELGGDGGDVGGRRFGFPEEFRPLHELYNRGDLAVVGNVGPLGEPTTRTAFQNNSVLIPPRLFSHNDQQSVWMASEPEGARLGWGGRFGDLAQAAGDNQSTAFTAISTAGSSVFLTGQNVRAFQVSTNGALSVNVLDDRSVNGSTTLPSILEDVLRDTGTQRSGLFQRDFANEVRAALDNNVILDSQLAQLTNPATGFPSTTLGGQLRVVADIIARREGFGIKRQVFFVALSGFDTHSGQTGRLPGLQADIANSMRAFYDQMTLLGMGDQVTAFTASDFGRSLNINTSGTDHGWGAHHVVVGGAVNGGQIVGDIPPPVFGHDQDAGNGRLIPTTSVDQYAAALGRWFGLSDNELLDSLPGLGRFDANALGSLFS